MNYEYNNVEHAHIRLDKHDKTHFEIKKVLIELKESDSETKLWQQNKDKSLHAIKNWFIGGTLVFILSSFGVLDTLKAIIKL